MTLPDYSHMDIIERWTLADEKDGNSLNTETCDWCGKSFERVGKPAGQYTFCSTEHGDLFHQLVARGRRQRRTNRDLGFQYRILYDATPLDRFGNDCRYPVGAIIPAVEYRIMVRDMAFTPGTRIQNMHTGEIITIERPEVQR